MPVLACPGGSAALSGNAEATCYANNLTVASALALAKVPFDADDEADAKAKTYSCGPATPPCRECDRHRGAVTWTQTGSKTSHWSFWNIMSRIFGAQADYTVTIYFSWSSVVTCDCRDY